ncbi:divergent polysaccharide deacteylase family protein [Salipiger bermudensis]|uniref:divergent polysaccharide deacteylase family protein n=1 Tax=Salipiger bermudensis TaxID=344736 RepID=UPI001CD24374|nr:divergent polysaccharide deacteylase family protein [Salipiger bermudensis]MCA1284651.1 divergent polysaccharide deacetylase family protein [Salipiger bermudensis]
MARGFLAGAIIGTVVSGVALGTVSVLTGPPQRGRAALPPEAEAPVSETAAPETAEKPEPEAPEQPQLGVEVASDDVSAEPAEPAERDVDEVVPEAATDPEMAPGEPDPEFAEPAAPEVAEVPEPVVESESETVPMAEETPARAADEADSSDIADSPAAPAIDPAPEPTLQDNAPQTSPEDGVETVTPAAGLAPDEPAGAETVARPGQPGEVTAAAPEPASEISVATDIPPEAETALDAPAPPATPDTDTPSMEMASADSPARRDSALPDAPQDEAAPEVSTQTPTPPLPAPLVPGEDALPRVSTLPGSPTSETAGTGRPAIGTPAGSLADRGAGESASRLPSIGEAAPAEPTPAPEAAPSELSPLERYAVPAEAEYGAPRMAIVLIDDGTGPLGPDTVGEFPFAVSFAIPASHPDAAATAQGYRDAGFEVLAIAGVPEGAQATDVEVTLEGSLGAVPEAVAVMEAPGDGLQATRAISEQAAQYLGASGHGLLMQPKGLNTGEALARREAVPTVTVFRDFDGEGQDPRVMRRFLDQAAFKARQEGAVVMLGRLRADTVSALLLWGLQDRASSVALVPISLVLRESPTDN